MPRSDAAPSNRLLSALPARDQKRILAESTAIELAFADVLYEPDERLRYVYFPTASFISLVVRTEKDERLEVGMVGREGMLGASAVLGVDGSPLHAVVQGSGPALRMSTAALRRQLAQSPALTLKLKRYLYVTMRQIAQTAACNRFHVVEARLARWLLMSHDRSGSEALTLTQEFLSYMLGVRRVGITRAATALQDNRLISYSRGTIKVLDRRGLEAAACGCYAADSLVYKSIMQH